MKVTRSIRPQPTHGPQPPTSTGPQPQAPTRPQHPAPDEVRDWKAEGRTTEEVRDCPRAGDSILVLQKQWLDRILDGSKVLEIRNVNKRPCDVFLAMSGTQTLYGRAHLGQAFRIKTDEQWRELQGQHLVDSRLRLYGDKTHGIPLSQVRRIAPVRYKTKQGAVGFVTFVPIDGPDATITQAMPSQKRRGASEGRKSIEG